MESLLFSPYIVATIALIASLIKFVQKQPDNGMARLMVVVWYLRAVFISTDAETRRVIGQWLLVSILFVESLSYLLHVYYMSRYHKAIEGILNPDFTVEK